jgi:membrane protein DedA with SNARE-associated domain
MQALVDSTIAFIEANKAWLPLIMVVFAAAETTAFLSILIPSTAILVAVGAMASTGAVDFWPLWAGATVGALIGSFFSFWLGATYGEPVLAAKPFEKHRALIDRAQAAFAKWGAATVFIGHFTSPLRPIVFLMAGMSGMSWPRFAVWNLFGATAWAYLIPKLGQVGGDLTGWLWSLLS